MPGPSASEAPDPVGVEDRAALLDRLGSVLLSAETIGTTTELVTLLASETITATAGAGLTLVDAHGQRSTAASNPLVEQADRLQHELGEGPCLTAGRLATHGADRRHRRGDPLGPLVPSTSSAWPP